MKIEIEFEEVEALRRKLRAQEDKIDLLEKTIQSLSAHELRKKSLSLSYALLDRYLEGIFNKLGFENRPNESFRAAYNLNHYLGEDWPNSDKLEVVIGANITNKFKRAFLELGIKTNET